MPTPEEMYERLMGPGELNGDWSDDTFRPDLDAMPPDDWAVFLHLIETRAGNP